MAENIKEFEIPKVAKSKFTFVNADANPVDDCSGHGGVLREEVI